jgi:hypothetical protein
VRDAVAFTGLSDFADAFDVARLADALAFAGFAVALDVERLAELAAFAGFAGFSGFSDFSDFVIVGSSPSGRPGAVEVGWAR